jgi:bacillithiol biosynthesis deacetylase BshB1
MVVAPHPDDAEISCGGTILALVARGARVAVVDMTRGERGTRGDEATRQAECAAATAALGLAERANLGLPDTAVRDDDEALSRLVGVLRRMRPRVLLAPLDRDLHPDHAATGAAVSRAFFHAGLVRVLPELGPPHRPQLLLRYPLHEEVSATLCVDISEFAERKLDVIRCYASQLPGDDPAARAHLSGLDPLERARARDLFYGALCGCRAAEPFATAAPLRVRDLLSLT